MAIKRSNALRSALMQAIADAIGNGGLIEIRTGTNASGDGTDGTLLVTLTGGTPWGTVSNGVLTSNAISSGVAVATGEAGHYVRTTSAGVFLESGLISGDGLTISNTSIASGQTVTASNWVETAASPAS